jgi:hypothetical protein
MSAPPPRLPGAPCHKIKFRTAQRARRWAASQYPEAYLRAYLCPRCGYWHNTSQPAKSKAA